MPSSTNKTIQIVTPRLTLEPLSEDHAAESFAAWQDERLFCYVPVDPPVDLVALSARYKRLAQPDSGIADERWFNWFMRDQISKRLVGLIECTLFADQTVQLAYFVFPEWQRRGYASEGCLAALDVLHRKYQATHVQAFIDTRNAASIALIRRLGLEQTKWIPGADFFKGASSDEFLFTAPLHCIRFERN